MINESKKFWDDPILRVAEFHIEDAITDSVEEDDWGMGDF